MKASIPQSHRDTHKGYADKAVHFRRARYQLTTLVFIIVLTGLLGACASVAPASLPEKTGQATEDLSIEKFLQDMVVDERFTGAVLVARGKEVIHAKGYGPATAELKNNVETKFHVASITKQFTAAAVMQLVEAGPVDLHASINSYLPKAYRASQWDVVTVHHLLTHTGGVPDYGVERDYYNVVDGFCLGDTVDGMIREAMSKPLEFKPGSKFSYSNIGFTLLGFIIENVSGEPYETYLEEKVLKPMGMLSSRVHVEGHVPAENEAMGFRWSEEHNTHVADDIVSLPVTAPDGGLVTTLEDFLKWTQIYAGAEQSILSPSSIKMMTSRHTTSDGKDGPMESYGYGLSTGDQFVGHSGYIVGFRSQFVFSPDKGLLVTVFTNNTSNDPLKIASGLLSILLAAE